MKEEQKQHIIDIMQKDEELGLYEYIGECKGNDSNGCFMDSSGHDCGCYTRSIKKETEHLLSTKANKERLLEDVFNDEKRQGVKELIDKHKQTDEKGKPMTYWGGLEEPKQETLEEFAERFYPTIKLDWLISEPTRERVAFIQGAKWQQEQIGKSEFLQRLRGTLSDAEARRLILEQFKKK